ncbi:macrophage mannose receptor 1-like isoform X1 [Lates calcarifer]|uniref:Macrophage mannose receptor 1-like isoform X1 n=1 Tax=Lates calcarifer TaxID=8187 RepID=A0AAJ7LEG4_LATCA|nr:macrophage mannose receptor 1-like isoform X1 [Lates calcarifer]
MEKVLLIITAAAGLCAVSSLPAHQYHLVYEQMNMTEAQSYCRENYTDLATIDNMEDVNLLNSMADLSKMIYPTYSYLAWIGLYDDVNSWRWSLSDRSFYTQEEAEFRNWASGEPNNEYGSAYCTLLVSNGQWSDVPCDVLRTAVCMDVRGSNVTFVFINNLMTWTEAQSYCRANHTDLASVRNMEENQKIMELLPSGQSVWIGLFRDSWKWSDGSNSSFRYWITGEPNGGTENCVAANFHKSGKWEDQHCGQRRAFICYSPPVSKKVVRVRLMKKSSSLDLNDPAVMEDILRQLKQKLKDKGVDGDVKLSWRKQSDGKVFHKEKETEKKTTKKKDEL